LEPSIDEQPLQRLIAVRLKEAKKNEQAFKDYQRTVGETARRLWPVDTRWWPSPASRQEAVIPSHGYSLNLV